MKKRASKKAALEPRAHTGCASLKALGEEVLAQIDAKLTAGDGCLVVARWLQEELEVCTDVKIGTLKKQLERYRLLDLRPRLQARITAAAAPRADVFVRRFNVLEQLEVLVVEQRERVSKVLERERTLPGGLILRDASNEVRLLKELIVDLGRLHVETGILPRAVKRGTGTFVDGEGNVRSFEWTEEEEELLQALERGPLKVIDHAD
jgi:hypothetical protein